MILVGRVVLLLGAAAAVVMALLLHRGNGGPADGRSARPGAVSYACPMHPEVVGNAPTVCPICGMALEPVRPRPAGAGAGPAQTFSVPANGQNRLFYDVMFAKTHSITREMLAPAWIESDGGVTAILYNDEIVLLGAREAGTFQTLADAGHGLSQVRLAGVPPVTRDRATAAVRFVVTGGSRPAGGAVGWVKLAARTRPMLAVPSSAIIQSPTGPYVLVASVDRHTFSRRPVQIGRVLFGYAAVVSGVREGERVVAMNTFFLDAERRWGSRSDGADLEQALP